ncbi:arrestin domain-containing protein 3-like [Musca vetustissima]|uniref:arrestin domain-containing protein 3-like n=1 Tax=Musca vetustissima TaxID=27455 RepID=UPI002AB7D642|nr:arrestin domain-containing protein 3-like [Musca vetustissima]
MPSVCTFSLDHSNAVYYSGQTINGTISLKTTTEKQIRNARIVFLGEGKVKWEESTTTTDSNGNSTTSTTYYRSHEVYINNETIVRGEGVLPVGVHTYTFTIVLPLECPTSCEGRYGHIRYGISLILNRILRFDNTYYIPLTVLKTVDLNLNPVFKVPLLGENYASLGCWPCSSGKLFYSLQIPFAAYTPGQTVKFSLHLQNQSMTDTEGYYMDFIQKITFTAHSPSRSHRYERRTLVKRNYSEVCRRLTNRVFSGEFSIPSVPPTTEPSNIIYVEYKLKVTIMMSGCNRSKDISVPIFIGNVPIRESLQNFAEQIEHQNPTAPEMPTSNGKTDSEMPPNYSDLKPPSYQEAMQSESPFVDNDVDKHHRVNENVHANTLESLKNSDKKLDCVYYYKVQL